ncbi:hypothetical protein [Streptomyces sp. NBC_00343]|uniref:hypothetical protein n=1 Tax=Streptomyces sp. NBC_00343 TaxID=2975719 RepID=UPI002E2B58FB|nr:hypothetical protein [Streptomyces sp. NBC_00343]
MPAYSPYPAREPVSAPVRSNAAQMVTALAFPAMGGALLLAGTPMVDVFSLLGGCGAIGAAVVLAVSGGRRRIASVASVTAAVLRATAGK